MTDRERTRRELMRRGIAAGGAVLAVGAIPRLALAQAKDDAAILEAALDIEQKAVVAYDAAAESGVLEPGDASTAELFRDQEQEHADGLTRALESLGGEAPAKPQSPAEVPGLAAALDQGAPAIFEFAIELETMAVAAYYDALGRLRDPQLLSAVASIMAAEGQHLVVLRQALGLEPVPRAFERGAGE